ncbi:MAG TPA: iron-containing alcohol dehydrogenase [Candidatus Eremiobacteraeota bacterium]|nr:iron-containing alcohol dehydrogenase [Candidatus Eremiobacteraeota bacterium]
MKFEFATATRIIFGAGTIKEVPSLAAELGERLLIVTGKNFDRASALIKLLKPKGMSAFIFSVSGEPSIETVMIGIKLARKEKCKFIISIGGGSAIDTGKAISALLTNKGEVLDYLEVIGHGKALTKPSAPFIAIPTTSGTGAEVTKNAVLFSSEHHVKVSLRSNLMLPRIAVIDPELTLSLPPSVTASTGLDALTQLIEPYVCNSPNPLIDTICLEGIKRIVKSLRKAYKNGSDLSAREDMSLASLFGGMALANAKLGAVHGFAGPLGGMFSAPHGAVCARLLPVVMKFNVNALKEREPSSPVLSRYTDVAQLLTGKPSAIPSDEVDYLYSLCDELGILALGTYGLTEDDIPSVVAQAEKASSMKGNPILLTEEELKNILKEAL